MSIRVGVRIEKAAATRAALVAAARRLFAERGYHGAGTPELVAAAGVTRGALYHHFRDKEDLFEAVFREVSKQLSDTAADRVANLVDDPWRQCLEGIHVFLQLIAENAEVQRIMLIDAPAVFGWVAWRELESEMTLGYLVDTMTRLMDMGQVRRQPPEPLAHLIQAALYDTALSIAHAADPEQELELMGEALRSLIVGLRVSD